MCSGLVDHLGAIAGRMACILAAALLACASSAHAQVIEEGGFPVKGNGVSGEPFSLSCPPRLYVEAGESVLLSCSATAVPEEGVGYEWESLSGNGLHLLSDANERSPLFTAPLSGEGAEYVYRLTAMSVGVYETASVTVAIGGVSGGSVQGRGKSPGALEDCDTFGALEEIGEGCVAEDKAPSPFEPFEGGPEAESGSGFLFPEPFGVPEKGFSGFARDGAADMEIAPVLECPSAIFLEELETGSIECHAWDASGEEYLDFAWEPVGSTTRDYLDNPRLIPEDAPTASVVAPEAPRYERLEDARSGEASAVYRYRLTAMSRVTGLSSSAEVEVYVSGNRPSVYCPSEVVVEEGASIVLGCEGVDPLSYRLDYNEASASIAWAWAGLWETGTDPLSSTEAASPVFEAPAGSAGEEYHYIASMMSSASGEPRTARRRVTVRVVGEADVSGRMNDFITFPGNPFTVNEGQRISFYYQRSHPPGGSATGITPVNSVPIIVYSVSYGDGREALFFYATDKTVSGHAPCVDANTTYEYKVCVVATGTAFGIQRSCSEDEQVVYASTQISITILDTGNPICIPVASLDCRNSSVYEGHGDLVLRCSVTNEPSGATYSWTGTDIANRLSSTTVLRPTFRVPDNVDSKTTYSYKVTMSADGVDDVTEDVTVTVYNRGTLDVACTPPPLVYEGSADVAFDCSASGTPSGYAYTYSWRARGATSGTSLLSRTDIASPVFDVPDEVDETTTYEYLLTVSAANAKDAKAEVTVTVLNRGVAERGVCGPRFGVRGFGGRCFRLFGVGGAIGFRVYALLACAGRDIGHIAFEQDGHCFACVRCAGRGGRDHDVRVPFDRLGGECERRQGRGDGDGAEPWRTECCMCGPRFGVRGFGGRWFRLFGVGGAIGFRVYALLACAGRDVGHIAFEQDGHCFACVRCAGRGGRDHDVRVPFDRLGGEYERRQGRGDGDGVEPRVAERSVCGPRRGVRGVGGHYAGVFGFGRSERLFLLVRMDGEGQYGEHGPIERYGYCLARVRCA